MYGGGAQTGKMAEEMYSTAHFLLKKEGGRIFKLNKFFLFLVCIKHGGSFTVNLCSFRVKQADGKGFGSTGSKEV